MHSKTTTTTANNHHRNHNLKPPLPPPLSISLPPQPEPQTQTQTRPIVIPKPETPGSEYDTALVPVPEKYYSPLTSPLPATPPPPASAPASASATASPSSHHIINFSRRDQLPLPPPLVQGQGEREREGKVRGVRFGGSEDVVTRSNKYHLLNKVGFGFRVFELVFSLVSFSVMASDKTQGWSGDSFDRYKEYRFCLCVAIFGFVYSAFQAYDLGSHIVTGKRLINHRFRPHFDFLLDQILAYLLISAASAAASRVDNWQENWGKDKFTEKASASISMAFLAFICFAFSSMISGYNLCCRDLY